MKYHTIVTWKYHHYNNNTQYSSQQNTAPHSRAMHSTAKHSTTQYSTAQQSNAQYSTAKHSTTQYSTAQHGACITSRENSGDDRDKIGVRQLRPRGEPELVQDVSQIFFAEIFAVCLRAGVRRVWEVYERSMRGVWEEYERSMRGVGRGRMSTRRKKRETKEKRRKEDRISRVGERGVDLACEKSYE